MTYTEMNIICSKFWLTKKDIMLLCACGRDKANEIMIAVRNEIKNSGKKIPSSKTKIVPTQSVLEYLGIDIEYIKKMSQ